MWGVGQGRFNRQHFFRLSGGIYEALCGLWTRVEPTKSDKAACFWCAQKKQEAERAKR